MSGANSGNGYVTITAVNITTVAPSVSPSTYPSLNPTVNPTTLMPSFGPSATPSLIPSPIPSVLPTMAPSAFPSLGPSINPTTLTPSLGPSTAPTLIPSVLPSVFPTAYPSVLPSVGAVTPSPSQEPSVQPTSMVSSASPFTSLAPSAAISSAAPSADPSASSSSTPTASPSFNPSVLPSSTVASPNPTVSPSVMPSLSASAPPTSAPSIVATMVPSLVSQAPVGSAAPTLSYAPSMTPTQVHPPTPSPSIIGSGDFSWDTTYSSNASFTLVASSSDGNRLVAASTSGIYASDSAGRFWNITSAPSSVWRAVAVDQTGELVYAAELDSGAIWKSANSGETWTQLGGCPLDSWTDIATDSTGKYVIASSVNGLWSSANYGDAWQPCYSVPSNWTSVAADASGQYLLAVAADSKPMYQSKDYGASWLALSSSTYNYSFVACDSSGTVIAAIVLSSPSSASTVSTVALRNTLAADSSSRMIILSTDGGKSFSVAATPHFDYLSVAISSSGSVLAATASDVGVYVSTNQGKAWTLSIGSSVPWYGVAMSSNASVLAVTTTSGDIYMASMLPSSSTKSPSSGPADDDGAQFVNTDTLESLTFLVIAILPALALVSAKFLARRLRQKYADKTSTLRSSWGEVAETVVKCLTWLFFVLDVSANPSNPGASILIVSRIPVVLAWSVLVYMLFQFSKVDVSSFEGVSMDTWTYGNVFLRQYLHAPSLMSNSISSTVSDAVWYGIILVIALFDLGLFTYLPWKRTEFTSMSRGYPTLFVTRCCLYTNMLANFLQSLGSIVIFLTASKKSLFGILFIVFALLNALRSTVDVMMLFLTLRLLITKEAETAAKQSTNPSAIDLEAVNPDDSIRSSQIELRSSTYTGRASAMVVGDADDVTTSQANPIHAKPSYLKRTQGVVVTEDKPEPAKPDGDYRAKFKNADETKEVLRSQLIKAGILPLEYISLAELRAELSVLFEIINSGQAYDESRLDYLLMCMELNPEHKAEKAEEIRKWRAEIEPFALECLRTMRAFVPPHVFSITEKSLTTECGYSVVLAKRIINKKCLWLLRMHPGDIDRLHEAELMGRFNPEAQNLDIEEVAAIYAVLPEKFTKDPKGKWRQNVEDSLKKLVQDKQNRKLSKEKLRSSAYANQVPAFVGRESLFSMDAVSSADAFRPRNSFMQLSRKAGKDGSEVELDGRAMEGGSAEGGVEGKDSDFEGRDEGGRNSAVQMVPRRSSLALRSSAHNSDQFHSSFASVEELRMSLVQFDPDGAELGVVDSGIRDGDGGIVGISQVRERRPTVFTSALQEIMQRGMSKRLRSTEK